MQKELDKLSGISPQIQACINGLIQNASQDMTSPYGSCVVEKREDFQLPEKAIHFGVRK